MLVNELINTTKKVKFYKKNNILILQINNTRYIVKDLNLLQYININL